MPGCGEGIPVSPEPGPSRRRIGAVQNIQASVCSEYTCFCIYLPLAIGREEPPGLSQRFFSIFSLSLYRLLFTSKPSCLFAHPHPTSTLRIRLRRGASVGAVKDGALFLEDFLQFREVFLQFPGGNVLFDAEGGRHPRRLAGDHGLLQEAVISVTVRGDRFTGNQEVFDFLLYQASVGDIMGTPVFRPHAVSGYGLGTGDMVAAGGETALPDDIRKFLRLGHILTGQDVIANNSPAFTNPEFRANPGDIGVFEAGHIFLKDFKGDLDLPAGLPLAIGEVPGVIRRAAGNMRRMLQMCQDSPVFGIALWHEEKAQTAHAMPFFGFHHLLKDGGKTSYFSEFPHILYPSQNLTGLLC